VRCLVGQIKSVVEPTRLFDRRSLSGTIARYVQRNFTPRLQDVKALLPTSAMIYTVVWCRRRSRAQRKSLRSLASGGPSARNRRPGEPARRSGPRRVRGNGDHIDADLRQTRWVSASGRRGLRPMGRQFAGALSQNPMNLLGLGKIAPRQRHAQPRNVTKDRRHVVLGGPIGVRGGALPCPRCGRSFGRRHGSIAFWRPSSTSARRDGLFSCHRYLLFRCQP
jgi:hypothetical protein